jgi:hypothetical protein
MMRQAMRAVGVLTIMVLGVIAGSGIAAAEPVPGPGVGDPAGLFTEVRVTSLQDGTALNGFDAPTGFDPLGGYPADIPAGSTPNPVSFAGTIGITDPVTGQTGLAYCIDLFTDTQVGVHYELGDWDAANVPNLGYVAYVLASYFPTVPTAPAAASDADRAAAVQAAIWFFSDRYVLDTASPLRAITATIVTDALTNGPAVEPAAPQLDVTPGLLPAPTTGELVGPFEVSGDGPATIRSVGVEVFGDQTGSTPLPDGATVQPGSSLWARSVSSSTPQGFVLERTQTVLQSSVYLYDGTNAGRADAQKLVLAQAADLTKRAGALLAPYAAGGLQITKHVLGDGAGRQGSISIDITCAPVGALPAQSHTVTIDAGATAGDHPRTVTGIPAGSQCTITEPVDGDTDMVDLAGPILITPATVNVVAGENLGVDVTNTYTRALGALQVLKTISGPAAGLQGVVTLAVTCDDPEFDTTFTLAASSPDGTYPRAALGSVPAGTTCQISEPGSGADRDAVLTSVVIDATTVTIVADQTATVTVTNTYDHPAATDPGSDPGSDDRRVAHGVLAASGADHGGALAAALLAMTLGAWLTVLARRSSRR